MGMQDMNTIYAYKCNMTYMSEQDPAEVIANYSTVWYPWYNLEDYSGGTNTAGGNVDLWYSIPCSSSGLNYMASTWLAGFMLLYTYAKGLIDTGIETVLNDLQTSAGDSDTFWQYFNEGYLVLNNFLNGDATPLGFFMNALFIFATGYDATLSSMLCSYLVQLTSFVQSAVDLGSVPTDFEF